MSFSVGRPVSTEGFVKSRQRNSFERFHPSRKGGARRERRVRVAVKALGETSSNNGIPPLRLNGFHHSDTPDPLTNGALPPSIDLSANGHAPNVIDGYGVPGRGHSHAQELLVPRIRHWGNPEYGAALMVQMRVREYELDQFGVVNNAVYVNYLDQARYEFCVRVGLDPDLVAKDGAALALIRQDMRYLGPLRSKDRFWVMLQVKQIQRTRCTWVQHLCKITEDGEGGTSSKVILTAETEGVYLNNAYRPTRVPSSVVNNIQSFIAGNDVIINGV